MDGQLSLFETGGQTPVYEPLAARLRPQTLEEIVGQQHLIGSGRILRRMIEQDSLSSMIFWGPPGVGKTTLAHVIARTTHANFIEFSAVQSGIREIRQVMSEAELNRTQGRRTIVFVDEIHRFNKAQQDAFLPFVERGSITLIGATTENPSFEVNSALLSRCRVFVLKGLEPEDILRLLRRALRDPRGLGDQAVEIGEDAILQIARFANGDARTALSILEMAVLNGEFDGEVTTVTPETVAQCTQRKALMYDRQGEEHYNVISALHKSMRNSDPDAAVYWLSRMLEAGEDPLYVARRVVRFASEDVGLADPRALEIAVNAYQACHFIGMPECTVHLTQAVVYMSLAPKSNALDVAYMRAREDALKDLSAPVPMNIRNGVTQLMRNEGYGAGYKYAHDYAEKVTDMQCLPDNLVGREYYTPTEQGVEGKFGQRLREIKDWKAGKR